MSSLKNIALHANLAACSVAVLAGCSLPSGEHIAKTTTYTPAPHAAPAVTEKRKIGNPYKVMGKWYYPISSSEKYRKKGVASWYGHEFHKKKTANGETYDMYAFTAAHTTLPLPTWVRVTNLENGRNIMVKVNDRGPFVRGRLIDLSYSSAQALGFSEQGTVPVLVEAMPTDGSPLKATMVAVSDAKNPPQKKPASSRFTHRISEKSHKKPDISEKPVSDFSALHVPIYVQTGAFSNSANAGRQQYDLGKIYNEIKVMTIEKDGQSIHRVRVGPLDSVDIADQVLARLIHEGYKEAIIAID